MTEKLRDNIFSGLQTFWYVGVPWQIKNYFRVSSVEERLGNTDLYAVKKQFCVLIFV
jgi:phosphate-selective porin